MGGKNKLQECLWEALQVLVPDAIKTAPFDKTIKGKIIKNYGDGTYDVLINNITYSKIKYINSTLALMSGVWVRIPQNNLNDMYIEREA